MYIVISKIKANRNRISKYGLIEPESKKVYFRSPSEVNQLMDKTVVVGLHRHSKVAVKPSSYFRKIAVIGDNNEQEAFTVIKQYVGLKEREFELCDGIGITRIVTENELRELLKQGVIINGVQLRSNGILAISKAIKVCPKED